MTDKDMGSVKNRFWGEEEPPSYYCGFRLKVDKGNQLRKFLGQPSIEDGGVKWGKLAKIAVERLLQVQKITEVETINEIEGF